jgi:hypothetical protein
MKNVLIICACSALLFGVYATAEIAYLQGYNYGHISGIKFADSLHKVHSKWSSGGGVYTSNVYDKCYNGGVKVPPCGEVSYKSFSGPAQIIKGHQFRPMIIKTE